MCVVKSSNMTFCQTSVWLLQTVLNSNEMGVVFHDVIQYHKQIYPAVLRTKVHIGSLIFRLSFQFEFEFRTQFCTSLFPNELEQKKCTSALWNELVHLTSYNIHVPAHELELLMSGNIHVPAHSMIITSTERENFFSRTLFIYLRWVNWWGRYYFISWITTDESSAFVLLGLQMEIEFYIFISYMQTMLKKYYVCKKKAYTK